MRQPDNATGNDSSAQQPDEENTAAGRNAIDAQMLLAFLYRSPIGMVEVSADGALGLMNPRSVALLSPFAPTGMRNLFTDFGGLFDDIQAMIEGYQPDSGEICREYRIDICPNQNALDEILYFTFTISKLESDQFFVCFDDVTQQVISEEENKRLVSRMLHDLGNAISGIATRVARLACESDWAEVEQLKRLLNLVGTERSALDSVLGEGKGSALAGFLGAIVDLLEERSQASADDVAFLATSIRHVEQVMNIHRHYASSGMKQRNELLDVSSLIQESLLIANVLINRKQVVVATNIEPDLPKFSGDRTKLLRLLVNLLKNSVEAMEADAAQTARSIKITAAYQDDALQISITDNGGGFDDDTAQQLFKRGFTSKSTGTGIGLYNCREIARSHGGELLLESPGCGQGATATVRLACPIANSAETVKPSVAS